MAINSSPHPPTPVTDSVGHPSSAGHALGHSPQDRIAHHEAVNVVDMIAFLAASAGKRMVAMIATQPQPPLKNVDFIQVLMIDIMPDANEAQTGA